MPLTIFNLSKVDHIYIGRDTVIAFTDVPEFETYNVEIASEDKIKEHTGKFLGLTGYYRKFVPRFADISRHLTQLTKKETKFMWTPECQKSFELLKSFLCGEPILKYADTSKPYTLHTFKINEVIAGDKEIKNDPDLHDALQCIDNLIAPERLKHLHEQDATIETLKHKLTHNKLDKEYYNIDERGLLTRKVTDGGHKFCAIYLLAVLVLQVLHAAHDDLGHNGFPRTYAALKRVFY